MQIELFDNPQRDALLQLRRGLLGDSWFNRLGQEFDKDYMVKISQFLTQRRQQVMVYPESKDVFRAYQLCSYESTKVVIICQNPYHDGTATGVAMGVKNPKTYPKTIDILDTAIADDLYEGFRLQPIDPDLEYLEAQGVLLINSSLTVEHGDANTHLNIGWQKFVKATIEALNEKEFVIYLLWGSSAQQFKGMIADKHVVILAEHPNKHRYENRPTWNHLRPFSKSNQLLINAGLTPINW